MITWAVQDTGMMVVKQPAKNKHPPLTKTMCLVLGREVYQTGTAHPDSRQDAGEGGQSDGGAHETPGGLEVSWEKQQRIVDFALHSNVGLPVAVHPQSLPTRLHHDDVLLDECRDLPHREACDGGDADQSDEADEQRDYLAADGFPSLSLLALQLIIVHLFCRLLIRISRVHAAPVGFVCVGFGHVRPGVRHNGRVPGQNDEGSDTDVTLLSFTVVFLNWDRKIQMTSITDKKNVNDVMWTDWFTCSWRIW